MRRSIHETLVVALLVRFLATVFSRAFLLTPRLALTRELLQHSVEVANHLGNRLVRRLRGSGGVAQGTHVRKHQVIGSTQAEQCLNTQSCMLDKLSLALCLCVGTAAGQVKAKSSECKVGCAPWSS